MDEHETRYHARREAWRMEREAKRAAWRARWAARRASRGDWSHFADPKFWGLDAESMKQWGFTPQQPGEPYGAPSSSSETAELKARVAEMEKTIATLHQRVIVLEKLAVDDETRLAHEIEKLRGADEGKT